MQNRRAEDLNEKEWISASSAARTLGVHRNTALLRAAKYGWQVKRIDGVPYLYRRDVEKAAKEQARAVA